MGIKTINNSKSNKLLLIAYSYYLAIVLIPIVQGLISVYVQLFSVGLTLIIILFRRNSGRMLMFVCPFLFLLILQSLNGILNETTGVYDFLLYNYNLVVVYFHVLVSFYLLATNNRKAMKVILVITIFFIIITAVTSIIGLQAEPMAARMIATPKTGQAELLRFRRMNIGGFEFVYICVLLVPMIIASYKFKKIKLWQCIIILILISYYVLLTQYTMALLLLIFALFSFFLPKKATYKKIILIAVVAIIFVLLFRPLFAQLFYIIANNMESYMLQVKISAVGDVIAGVDNNQPSLIGRQMVYQQSVDAFFTHPFLGNFLYENLIGGHSFILDALGLYGVFGLFALVLVYRQIYRYFYLPFKKEPYYGYMLWTLVLSILLAIFNPSESMLIIGLIVPITAYNLQSKTYIIKASKGKLV